MAQFLSKTSVFSPWHQHRRCCFSAFPDYDYAHCRSAVPSSVRRFPSLKLKHLKLRSLSSSSSNSDFHGGRIVLQQIGNMPKRRISQASTTRVSISTLSIETPCFDLVLGVADGDFGIQKQNPNPLSLFNLGFGRNLFVCGIYR